MLRGGNLQHFVTQNSKQSFSNMAPTKLNHKAIFKEDQIHLDCDLLGRLCFINVRMIMNTLSICFFMDYLPPPSLPRPNDSKI